MEEIIELAIVLFSFHRQTGKILETIDQYVGLREPSCPISPGAYRVHRISRKAVQGKTLDHARIEAMISQAEFIIAHNAQFDLGFVKRLFPEAASKPWLCSMTGINWYRKGYRSRGLQNLLTAHDIRVETAHRADADVHACLLLLSRQNAEGKPYLLELIEKMAPQAKERSG